MSYLQYDHNTAWLVVSEFGNQKQEIKAFQADPERSTYFPLDPKQVYETLQNILVRPPKIESRIRRGR